MDNKVTPGEIVVMAAGAVGIIATFLPFADPDFGDSVSAWNGDFFGLFPVATLIGIYVLIAGALVALTKFANVQIGNVLGFSLVQIVLVLGLFATIQALAVGAVLLRNERGAAGTV